MKTVARLFRSNIKTGEFERNVKGERATRLEGFLKNETFTVFVIMKDGVWMGYVVTSYTHGDPTLRCHYFEEFYNGGLDRFALLILLDHTGFEYMSCPGPTDTVVESLLSRGFVHTDSIWEGSPKEYLPIPVPGEIRNVSGERYNDLTTVQQNRIRDLIGSAVYEEMQADLVQRHVSVCPIIDTVMARITHANTETSVWVADKEIVGLSQARLVDRKTASLSGLVVAHTHRNKGIGRRLMIPAMHFAGRFNLNLNIECSAGNHAAMRLYGRILNMKQTHKFYVLVRDPELINWKTSKRNKKGGLVISDVVAPKTTKSLHRASESVLEGIND